jgi:hypothetical protein
MSTPMTRHARQRPGVYLPLIVLVSPCRRSRFVVPEHVRLVCRRPTQMSVFRKNPTFKVIGQDRRPAPLRPGEVRMAERFRDDMTRHVAVQGGHLLTRDRGGDGVVDVGHDQDRIRKGGIPRSVEPLGGFVAFGPKLATAVLFHHGYGGSKGRRGFSPDPLQSTSHPLWGGQLFVFSVSRRVCTADCQSTKVALTRLAESDPVQHGRRREQEVPEGRRVRVVHRVG